MKSAETFHLIGQLHYLTAKLDFLVSTIAIELGILKDYREFLEVNSHRFIIRRISDKIKSLCNIPGFHEQFNHYLEQVLKVQDKKQMVEYGILLNTDDEYFFHDFKKAGLLFKEIKMNYKAVEIYNFNETIVTLNNQLYTLWGDFQRSKRLVRSVHGAGKKPAFSKQP